MYGIIFEGKEGMMSLSGFKKQELADKAKEIDLDVSEDATKAELIMLLDDAGVTDEDFEQEEVVEDKPEVKEEVKSEVKEESKSEERPKQVLVKMDRRNAVYATQWGTFTREHPFKVLSYEDAKALMDAISGFRVASPSEAESYYS